MAEDGCSSFCICSVCMFSKIVCSIRGKLLIRPDIAIKTGKSIITLELTICHESNIQSSKTYKLNKYKNLSSHLLPSISTSPLKNFTIEVTTLGLISDISPFLKLLNLGKFSSDLIDQIRNSVISNSYNIYCSRNTAN